MRVNGCCIKTFCPSLEACRARFSLKWWWDSWGELGAITYDAWRITGLFNSWRKWYWTTGSQRRWRSLGHGESGAIATALLPLPPFTARGAARDYRPQVEKVKIVGRIKSRCTVKTLCSNQVVSEWVEYHLKLTAGKVVVALYALLSVSKMCLENMKLHLHLRTLHQNSYLHVGVGFVL
jgi:hypothetical protein